MFADYSAEIFQPLRNTNVTYEDRPKNCGCMAAKTARFNSRNSRDFCCLDRLGCLILQQSEQCKHCRATL